MPDTARTRAALQTLFVDNDTGNITPSFAQGQTATNLFGLRIDAQKIAGITNAYDIYQAGASDLNYFAGTVSVGGANATNATVGFFMVNSSAGRGTGVPASIPTGTVPLQYDTTNNKLYAYNSAWRSTAAFT